VYMDNLEIGGISWWFQKGKLLYIQNSSQVYMKTDYHIQYMTPNRQYASPASNFQPTKQIPHYKTPDPWNPTSETDFLTSKTFQIS